MIGWWVCPGNAADGRGWAKPRFGGPRASWYFGLGTAAEAREAPPRTAPTCACAPAGNGRPEVWRADAGPAFPGALPSGRWRPPTRRQRRRSEEYGSRTMPRPGSGAGVATRAPQGRTSRCAAGRVPCLSTGHEPAVDTTTGGPACSDGAWSDESRPGRARGRDHWRNSGVGPATVRPPRREGAKAVAGDLGTDELRRETGEDVHAVEIDLSVPTGPQQLAAVARDLHGRIDGLVNNVGRAINRTSFLEVTDDDWRASLNLNLLAMARMSRAVLPTMLEQGKE